MRGPLLDTCNFIPNSASPFTVSCNKDSKQFPIFLFSLQTRYCPELLLEEPDERSHPGSGLHFCNGKKSFVKLRQAHSSISRHRGREPMNLQAVEAPSTPGSVQGAWGSPGHSALLCCRG